MIQLVCYQAYIILFELLPGPLVNYNFVFVYSAGTNVMHPTVLPHAGGKVSASAGPILLFQCSSHWGRRILRCVIFLCAMCDVCPFGGTRHAPPNPPARGGQGISFRRTHFFILTFLMPGQKDPSLRDCLVPSVTCALAGAHVMHPPIHPHARGSVPASAEPISSL